MATKKNAQKILPLKRPHGKRNSTPGLMKKILPVST